MPNFPLSKFSQIIILHQWLTFMITFGTACYTCTNGNVCASFVLISFCFCGGGHWTKVLTTLGKCSITESFWPVAYLATACSPLQTYLFVSVSFFIFLWTQLNIYLCDLEMSYFFFWELFIYVFCSFFPHWIMGHFLTDLWKSLTHYERRLMVHLQSGLQTLLLDLSFGEIFPHKHSILWPGRMTQAVEGFNSKRENPSSRLAPESESCLV